MTLMLTNFKPNTNLPSLQCTIGSVMSSTLQASTIQVSVLLLRPAAHMVLIVIDLHLALSKI